jgi:hypothetical protein
MSSEKNGDGLQDQEHQLAGAFYKGDAEEIRLQLDLKIEEEHARAEIAAATGIDDVEVLAELAGLGIRVDTLTALVLIPLVDAAWADGAIDPRERDAILTAATETGIEEGSHGYRLLEIWMMEEPPPDLTNAWTRFIHARCEQLSGPERERFEINILDLARKVAAAAGDARNREPHISVKEDTCIAELAKAFHA